MMGLTAKRMRANRFGYLTNLLLISKTFYLSLFNNLESFQVFRCYSRPPSISLPHVFLGSNLPSVVLLIHLLPSIIATVNLSRFSAPEINLFDLELNVEFKL